MTKNSIFEDPKCVLLQYPNCLKYWPDERCIQCEEKYYLKNKQCYLWSDTSTVENCLSYEENNCVICKENYQLINGKCVIVENIIVGCAIYEDDSKNTC